MAAPNHPWGVLSCKAGAEAQRVPPAVGVNAATACGGDRDQQGLAVFFCPMSVLSPELILATAESRTQGQSLNLRQTIKGGGQEDIRVTWEGYPEHISTI